jgi:hypothetical protein
MGLVPEWEVSSGWCLLTIAGISGELWFHIGNCLIWD